MIIAGIAVAALALTGCGASGSRGFESDDYDYGGYSSNGGWTDSDWDMDRTTVYNNNTYCQGSTYMPLANNQYSCNRNGVITAPLVRPKPIIPPKSQQKAPADVLKRVEQQKAERLKQRQEAQKKAEQQKQQQQSQKNAPAQKAPAPAKPPAPAKAPPAKTK